MSWLLPVQRSPADKAKCCVCGAPCPLPAAFVRCGYNGYALVTEEEATQSPGPAWWTAVDMSCWRSFQTQLEPYVTLKVHAGTRDAPVWN